jgi:hypothetical protein
LLEAIQYGLHYVKNSQNVDELQHEPADIERILYAQPTQCSASTTTTTTTAAAAATTASVSCTEEPASTVNFDQWDGDDTSESAWVFEGQDYSAINKKRDAEALQALVGADLVEAVDASGTCNVDGDRALRRRQASPRKGDATTTTATLASPQRRATTTKKRKNTSPTKAPKAKKQRSPTHSRAKQYHSCAVPMPLDTRIPGDVQLCFSLQDESIIEHDIRHVTGDVTHPQVDDIAADQACIIVWYARAHACSSTPYHHIVSFARARARALSLSLCLLYTLTDSLVMQQLP